MRLASLMIALMVVFSTSVLAEDLAVVRARAENGDAIAQLIIGNGYLAQQDYTEALKWFRLSAEQGLDVGQSELGLMYHEGHGVTQDDKEALRWFRLSAEQGDPKGQFFLGLLYAQGQGVVQNHKEALKWTRLAAEQGFVKAQDYLGTVYLEGKGVLPDYEEAAKWFRLAAEHGDAFAQLRLGAMYEKGAGVAQDVVQSHMWLSLALSNGLEGARESLARVERKMTPEQIAQAQKLAREWKPRGRVLRKINQPIKIVGTTVSAHTTIEWVTWSIVVLLALYFAYGCRAYAKSGRSFNLTVGVQTFFFWTIAIVFLVFGWNKLHMLWVTPIAFFAALFLVLGNVPILSPLVMFATRKFLSVVLLGLDGSVAVNNSPDRDETEKAIGLIRQLLRKRQQSDSILAMLGDVDELAVQDLMRLPEATIVISVKRLDFLRKLGWAEEDALRQMAAERGQTELPIPTTLRSYINYIIKREQRDGGASIIDEWIEYSITAAEQVFSKGVVQEGNEAVRSFRWAAEQGDGKAQYNLGLMYRGGQGVVQDYKEALKWFRLAAEQGNAEAECNIGALYWGGRGVAQDDAEALKWVSLAAEHGDAGGQWILGIMYDEGEGVPQDPVQAHMWFNLAGSNGSEKARESLVRVEKKMTPAQIAQAQKLAREWKPKTGSKAAQ